MINRTGIFSVLSLSLFLLPVSSEAQTDQTPAPGANTQTAEPASEENAAPEEGEKPAEAATTEQNTEAQGEDEAAAEPAPAPQPDYVTYTNVKLDGFDPFAGEALRKNEPTQEACSAKCLATPGCFIFDWHANSTQCWLQRPEVNKDWDVYAKHPHEGRRPTYQIWPNFYIDSQGLESVNVLTKDECLEKCSREDQCAWAIMRHKDPNNKDPKQQFECRIRGFASDTGRVVGVRMKAPLRDACTGANGFHCSKALPFEGMVAACASCDWEEDSCGQYQMKCGLNTRAVGVRWTAAECLPPGEHQLDDQSVPEGIEKRPECERKVLCYRPEWEAEKCDAKLDNYENKKIGDAKMNELELAKKPAPEPAPGETKKKPPTKFGYGLRWSKSTCDETGGEPADLSKYNKLELAKVRALLPVKECEYKAPESN